MDCLRSGLHLHATYHHRQAATYAVFVLLTVGAFFRLRFRLREADITSYAEAHLFYAMFFSSVFLVIRSAFRTVEGIQGHDGELQTKEGEQLASWLKPSDIR